VNNVNKMNTMNTKKTKSLFFKLLKKCSLGKKTKSVNITRTMTPEHIAQAIKEAAQIYDVVSRFVDLKKEGSRYVGLCPFHTERTPSFKVTPSRNRYKCFGCGKGGDATEFLKEHQGMTYPDALRYLAEMVGISIEDERGHRAPYRPHSAAPRPAPDFISKDVFRASLKGYERNNFVAYLRKRFGEDAAAEMIERYPVGTSDSWKPGAVVFWYLDAAKRTRYGKLILYDPDTGKRDRSGQVGAMAAHTLLKLAGNFSPCWFGEHLLAKCPTAPVYIVESEKTAIVASLYDPETVWLAAGGQGITDPAKWEPLAGRRVVLFPDADAPDPNTNKSPYTQWSEHAERLRKLGYNVTVSELLETEATPEDRAAKYDLADFLLKWEPQAFRAAQEARTAPPQPAHVAPSQPANEHRAAAPPMPQPPTAPQPVAPGVPSGWQRIEQQNKFGDTVRTWLDADGLPANWSEKHAPALAALDTDTEPRPYQSQIELCERYGFMFTGQSEYNPAKDDGLLDRCLERMERHRAGPETGYIGRTLQPQKPIEQGRKR
jgi:hypothetical protein